MDNDLVKLVNPASFTIEFMGQTYQVRKATLDKTIQYQSRFRQLQKQNDEASEIKTVAYCLYIMLKDQIPDLTEDMVLENVPGDIDPIQILVSLGFLNPSKVASKKIQETQ